MADNVIPPDPSEGQNATVGGERGTQTALNTGGAGGSPVIPAPAGTQTTENDLLTVEPFTMEQLKAVVEEAVEERLAERVKLVLNQANVKEVDEAIVAQVGVVVPAGTAEERALSFPPHYERYNEVLRPPRFCRGFHFLDCSKEEAGRGFLGKSNFPAMLEYICVRSWESYLYDLALHSVNPKVGDSAFRVEAQNALTGLLFSLKERRQVIEMDGESKLPGREKREKEAADAVRKDYRARVSGSTTDLVKTLQETRDLFNKKALEADLKAGATRSASTRRNDNSGERD